MAERESKPREPSPAFYGGYAYLPNTGSRLSSAGGGTNPPAQIRVQIQPLVGFFCVTC